MLLAVGFWLLANHKSLFRNHKSQIGTDKSGFQLRTNLVIGYRFRQFTNRWSKRFRSEIPGRRKDSPSPI